MRKLHSLLGLWFSLLSVVLAVSGAILSLDPALERISNTIPADGQVSVAMLASRVAQNYPGVEQIQRTPSGSFIVYYNQDGQTGIDRVDPQSGKSIAPYTTSPFFRWMKNLHRSWMLDTFGRVVSGLVAIALLVLSVTGVILLVRRVGGWRYLGDPLRGNFSQRLHTQVSRFVVLGLMLSSLTGLYMSAVTFEFVSDGTQDEPDFPTNVVSGPAAPISKLSALIATDLNQLRELVYPDANDPSGVFSLSTDQGEGYVDSSSGELISYMPYGGIRKTYELIYKLHTGEGLWWLGLLLGLCAFSVPLLSVTGTLIWWERRESMPRIVDNSATNVADTVILVGSENNSTWGFANTLHVGLRKAGLNVHTASMNELVMDYPKSERLFILTSTYGDGDAPSSANQFMMKLNKIKSNSKTAFAVLGFGDRQFPKFCKFAYDTEEALLAKGLHRIMDIETIDRQSEQAFERWGRAVGQLIGKELTLVHTPKRPRTDAFTLIERDDYGEAVQAPTSILRFRVAPPKSFIDRLTKRGLPYFEVGDLLGIVPPSSTTPRFYSLASKSSDGVMEICVRKVSGGLCSEFLHGLRPGDRMDGFIQLHPDFRPVAGKTPVILIGAGTGIGPLAGFIRNNTGKHPMFLYWGGRDPASDFLYKPELDTYLSDGRLTGLHAAFSRVKDGTYVHDRILGDAIHLRELLEQEGQVLVCGGRAMAKNVAQAIDEILAPLNLSVADLKAQGRYREDVY